MNPKFKPKSLSESVVEQRELLQFVVGVLERLGIRYAVVGSFASGIWGETRFTQNIDIVIQQYLAAASYLFDEFPVEQFYVSQAAVQEAVKLSRPFNVIHPESGNKIYFMVASAAPSSEVQLSRRVRGRLFTKCKWLCRCTGRRDSW